jgi:hypothetical protein
MSQDHKQYIRDQNKRIIFALETLVEYAKVADTRGRAIAEMWEKQETQKQPKKLEYLNPELVEKSRPYDWWRLENGAYAKVYKTQLQGEIYQEDGKMLQRADWNPLSLVSMDRLDGKWNLKNRKSGDNPAGWPDWCK